MKKDFEDFYYDNTTKEEQKEMKKFIKKNKNKKLWSVSLYYDVKRLAKCQRAKHLFWEGAENDFNFCRTSDLKKYNGLYTFDEAFELFKEFELTDAELIRLNFDIINDGELVLVRG